MRGELAEGMLQPSRYLLREAAMIETRRVAHAHGNAQGRHDERRRAPGGGGGGGGGSGSDSESESSLARGESFKLGGLLGKRRANKYVVLCNDSLWYCELLRGNNYRVLHVFHFVDEAGGCPFACGLHAERPHAFWLADHELHLQLELPKKVSAGPADAAVWVAAIDEAIRAQLAARGAPKTAPEHEPAGLEAYLESYRKRFYHAAAGGEEAAASAAPPDGLDGALQELGPASASSDDINASSIREAEPDGAAAASPSGLSEAMSPLDRDLPSGLSEAQAESISHISAAAMMEQAEPL